MAIKIISADEARRIASKKRPEAKAPVVEPAGRSGPSSGTTSEPVRHSSSRRKSRLPYVIAGAGLVGALWLSNEMGERKGRASAANQGAPQGHTLVESGRTKVHVAHDHVGVAASQEGIGTAAAQVQKNGSIKAGGVNARGDGFYGEMNYDENGHPVLKTKGRMSGNEFEERIHVSPGKNSVQSSAPKREVTHSVPSPRTTSVHYKKTTAQVVMVPVSSTTVSTHSRTPDEAVIEGAERLGAVFDSLSSTRASYENFRTQGTLGRSTRKQISAAGKKAEASAERAVAMAERAKLGNKRLEAQIQRFVKETDQRYSQTKIPAPPKKTSKSVKKPVSPQEAARLAANKANQQRAKRIAAMNKQYKW